MRLVGVDVGGTFTDLAVFEDGSLTGRKVLTDADHSATVMGALSWDSGDWLLHGTTAATNALLEETGARVALVTGLGYEDLVEIGRQDRPSLYDSSADRPTPVVTREHRIGHGGDLADTIARLTETEPEVVAVGLIGSYLDAAEESSLAAAIRSQMDVPVVESQRVSPEFREYERIATTVLSAYLTPAVAGYLESLDRDITAGHRLVMTSSGGLIPFDQGASSAARLVLSGPAGGVVAAAALGGHHGYDSVISFDMGGTSTDVCLIAGGLPAISSGHQVAGRVNRVPSIPVRTIGAGGGSVAWFDSGGSLRVGPRSAGANPGPAAYGRGGIEPTVTDAHLVLGNIPSTLALGGVFTLDMSAAEVSLARLAESLGMATLAIAEGVLEVVDSHMEHALRSVSVEQGADPRESVLVAFGGAGGLHAGRLARRLGIGRVLVPPMSGVFSALGLLLAEPRADSVRTVALSEGDGSLQSWVRAIGAQSMNQYRAMFDTRPSSGPSVGYECRYVGQSHELEVAAPADWARIRIAFEDTHRERFGFIREGEPIEVVNIRSVVTGEPPMTWADLPPMREDVTPVGDDGVWQRSTLPPGFELDGPAVVVEDNSAVLLMDGDRLTVLEDGTLEVVS